MTSKQQPRFSPSVSAFRNDVLSGLSAHPKSLMPKYFYDDRGCELFVEITQLEEYYVSRSELALLKTHGQSITQQLHGANTIIELGGPSGDRSRLMLSLLDRLQRYVPVDVAPEALNYARKLATEVRPDVRVDPLKADFSQGLKLDQENKGPNVVCYFPGSTIGNFDPEAASAFLRSLRYELHGGFLLIGVDLHKSTEVLERAYDDEAGVTAEFNLNLLRRINRELGANFDLTAFDHKALYDASLGRIEMHLVSRLQQTVLIDNTEVVFSEGETIHTENSYKYTLEGFKELAGLAGWSALDQWVSPNGYFSTHLLRAVNPVD